MVFNLNRREFIVSGIATVATLTRLRTQLGFTDQERETLIAIAQTLFPHAGADRSLYAAAIDDIEGECLANRKLFEVVSSGVTALEWACGGQFAKGTEAERVRVLCELEPSRFYRVVYGQILHNLYGSARAWRLLA